MKILKNILSFILVLIITILICLIFSTNLLNSTILSKSYFLSKLNETDYYNQIQIFVESNFEKYINQSGLDEDVIKNLVTAEKIKLDTDIILNNIYENTQESIDIQTIETNLRSNIENYLTQNNLTANQNDIDDFVSAIGNEYLSCISHTKYEQKIYEAISKVKKVSNKVMKMSVVVLAVGILLLALINLKTFNKFFTKFGVSLFSSGLLLMFINIYINKKIDVKNLLVLNDYFSYTLRKIASNILNEFFGKAIIFMIIGFVTIIVPICLNNLSKKERNDSNNGRN